MTPEYELSEQTQDIIHRVIEHALKQPHQAYSTSCSFNLHCVCDKISRR